MSTTVVLDGDVNLLSCIDGDTELVQIRDGDAGIVVLDSAYPAYTGPTEITPSNETQTLNTANKSVLENIVVNPIPDNYGLVTWNGSVLTVS